MMTSLAFPERRVLSVDLYPRVTTDWLLAIDSGYMKQNWAWIERIPLPDFITSARRELMESAVFLVFLVGAIVADQDLSVILKVVLRQMWLLKISMKQKVRAAVCVQVGSRLSKLG